MSAIQDATKKLQDGANLFRRQSVEKVVNEANAAVSDLERARAALGILQKYNPLHNDLEAYLLEVGEWGLGQRDDKPDPKNFGVVVDSTPAPQ